MRQFIIFSFVVIMLLYQSASSAQGDANPGPAQGAPGPPASSNLKIETMHKQPFFLTVLFASAGGWVLGLVKGFSTSKNWLEGIGLPSPPLLVFFLDIFIF